jgi:hypothetical protein
LRILFIGRRFLYFRNYESVIRALAERGHEIHLAVERDDTEGPPAFVDVLTNTFPNITCSYAPVRENDDWSWMASRLRLGLDYLRYQHPLFDDTPKLTDRSRERTPGAFVRLGHVVRRYAGWARRPVTELVRRFERAIPEDASIRAFVESRRPDVVLITPLIDVGSSQIEYLRAARALRIPTAICVWSWDHLSSKALIRECPDRVLVWNETQKREAIELHGVPPARIVITGAQCFDVWFDRQPTRDRETFCTEAGLPADRPFVLYVCSAPFLGSQAEAPFVLEWIRRVRASALTGLHEAPILVRPHPSRMREWEGIDVTAFGNVAVRGGSPVDSGFRDDYFDALYHSALVVGLNTSAFIEAGIIGRPVHTILLPEWYENQEGTLHFRYLLDVDGGLLEVARDFDTHLRQLADSLQSESGKVEKWKSGKVEPGDDGAGRRPFIRSFVRPHGIDVAATPVFVQAVEQMQTLSPQPPAADVLAPFTQRLLRAIIGLRHRNRAERWLYSTRELDVMERDRRALAETMQREAELRARSQAAREVKRAEREREWNRHRAARAAQDAEKKAARQ